MRRCSCGVVASAGCRFRSWLAYPCGPAAVSEPADPKVDAAPCFAAAIAKADPDQIVASCGPVIDNEKTPAADRLRALLARAAAYIRKQQDDRAIADYDVALKLDPTLADIFNARGELWRKKGDRPRALADFGAAIKLNPRPCHRARQLQIAGAGTGAARRPDGGRQQAELQLRHRQTPGGEGDLRRSGAGQSRPRDRGRPCAGAQRRRPRQPHAAARCGASRRLPAAPQRLVRPSRLRPAKGDEGAAAATAGVDGY